MNQVELTRFPALDYACKEAMNTLCTNLTFVGGMRNRIMITSCNASEGKSFLSMNIMRTLAQLGHSVVLVDADLRRSQIKARYGLHFLDGEGYGMTHYLAGICGPEDVVYATDIPGSAIVPVGHEVINSLAMLNTPRLERLFKQLSSQFEFVIVDAPPVGVIIDAAEIAKYCDGTIFVVKYNSVSRKELLNARQQIERSGSVVLGAVLNEVSFDSLSSKKYYNKSYYSHYNSDYYKPSKRRKPAEKGEKAANPAAAQRPVRQ